MTETTLPPRHDSATQPYPPLAAPPPPPPPAAPRGPRWWFVVLAAVVVSALVSAAVTLSLTNDGPVALPEAETPAPVAQTAADTPSRDDIAAVAAAVSPSVVHIAVAGAAGQGSGSGVVLRADGYVITNAHVIEGAQQVEVTLPDGTSHEAEVVGSDPATDIGVVRIPDVDDLPVAPFATAPPRVGDLAIAIGSPFGLEGSVTSGIVSAMNRSLPGRTTSLANMIQTDAAINPGNSGGALVNGDGEVIGINTAILSPSGANDGIGFAIPITGALPLSDQLIENGFVEHGHLGVSGQDVDPTAAELYNLGVKSGALIVTVSPESAADDAGIARGDIITAFDGEEVRSFSELAGYINAHQPGDQIEVTIVRGGEPSTLTVKLGAASATPNEAP